MTMDTSFCLLLVFAAAFGLAAADHYVFGGGLAYAVGVIGDTLVAGQ